jgi:hypothetical protein
VGGRGAAKPIVGRDVLMPTLLSRQEEVQALRLAGSQPESGAKLRKLVEQITSRVVTAVLAEAQVRQRIAGVRYRVLAVDYREDKPARDGKPARMAEVAIYDYDHDVLVVAAVDLRTSLLVDLYEREGIAPPITAEEQDDARRLVAAEIPALRAALQRKNASVVAFPIPSYAFESYPDRRRHRGCTLYIAVGRGQARAVTVDLSAGRIVPEQELPEILRSRGAGRSRS